MVQEEPLVMLQYVHPAAAHVTSVRSAPAPSLIPQLPTPLRAADPAGSISHACSTSKVPPLASETSELSRVEGDLRMQLRGTVMTSNQLWRDRAAVAEEARMPMPEFAWQGNPEFSPGNPGELSAALTT